MREQDSEYDEDLEDEEDDPNDPGHPDFDLSEAGGEYYHYEARPKPWYTRRWVLLIVAALVTLGLIIPILPR